jgi:hypothetical protein
LKCSRGQVTCPYKSKEIKLKIKKSSIFILTILFSVFFIVYCSNDSNNESDICDHGFYGESGECVGSEDINETEEDGSSDEISNSSITEESEESVSSSGKSVEETVEESVIEENVLSTNVIIVIIDGARYQETFGDPNRTYIPEMAKISEEGCINTQTYNDHETVTIYGVNSIRSGTWDSFVEDETGQVYLKDPCVWEYYRKEKNKKAETSYYVLKYISEDNLWLCSY